MSDSSLLLISVDKEEEGRPIRLTSFLIKGDAPPWVHVVGAPDDSRKPEAAADNDSCQEHHNALLVRSLRYPFLRRRKERKPMLGSPRKKRRILTCEISLNSGQV